MAFPAEVARYLCVEPQDVKQMIKLDRLPAVGLPKNKRTVMRIPLRDFHTWLKGRSKQRGGVLENYETFLSDFDAAARGVAETTPTQ